MVFDPRPFSIEDGLFVDLCNSSPRVSTPASEIVSSNWSKITDMSKPLYHTTNEGVCVYVCVCVCVINAHLAYIITTTESMTYTFSVLTGDSGKSGTRTCTYKVTCRAVLREHLTPPPSATHEEAKGAPEAPLGAGGAGAGAFTYTHRDVILYALGGGCGLVFGPLRVMLQHLLHFQLEPPCHRLILLNSSSCMKVTRTSPCCLHLLSSLPRYEEWSGDWLLSFSVDILLFQ